MEWTVKPFFAYVAFTAPHDPRQPPPEWREMYYRQLPATAGQFPATTALRQWDGKANLRDENLAAWPRSEKVIRDQIAEYYGMMSHLDQQIGRILDKLKSEGLARRHDHHLCRRQRAGVGQPRTARETERL
jgi:arylsulfatase A-like enzyme